MIIGAVGLVVLVLTALVWAGPDALTGTRESARTPTVAPGSGRSGAASSGSSTAAAAPRPAAAVPRPVAASTGPVAVGVTVVGADGPGTGTGPAPSTTVSVTGGTTLVDRGPLPVNVAERVERFNAGQVRFALGAADLDAAAIEAVDVLAPALVDAFAGRRGARALVQGHTDDSGPEDGNVWLSLERAQRVVEQLVQRGVPRQRLAVIGLASTTPIAPNDSDAGRIANRRVDLVLESGVPEVEPERPPGGPDVGGGSS